MTGIVILNYNNAGYTVDCLESIVKHNTAPVRIVVVDNASTDGSVAALSVFYEEFCCNRSDGAGNGCFCIY